jgi:hypothetical protein
MPALTTLGFEAAEPFEGPVHRVLDTRVWVVQYASYLRYGFGELIAIRVISQSPKC